jgi:hypothetical protein
MHPVRPPGDLSLSYDPAGGVRLTWGSPADSAAGYHIYSAESIRDGFARVNPNLVADTTYVDAAPIPGRDVYMVRAVKLESTAGGTYLNPSPGVTDSIDVTAGVDPGLPATGLRNSPNPFHTGTEITFSQPSACQVILRIHDVTGRLVRDIDAGRLPAGTHTLRWDGKDEQGCQVAGGVYFLSLRSNDATFSRKVVRIR